MCYAKPGPRCSYHVNQKMSKLQENVANIKTLIENEGDEDKSKIYEKSLLRLEKSLKETRKTFYTTPAGQEELASRIREAQKNGNDELAIRLSNTKIRAAEIRQEQMTAYTAAKHSDEHGISASRVNDYMQCPLKYRLQNIDRLPTKQSPAAFSGTQVHKVLEDTFALPPSKRTLEDAHRRVETEFNANSDDEIAKSMSEEEYSKMVADAKQLVSNWFDMENPKTLNPHNQERRIDMHYDGMNLRGYIDRVDRTEDGQYRIVDYKSGKSPQESYQDKYLFQMKFYAYTMWKTTGNLPKRMQLIFLGDKKNIVINPTEKEIAVFGERLKMLHQSMEDARKTGNFPPRKSKLCDYCEFKDKCPEFGGTPPPYPSK